MGVKNLSLSNQRAFWCSHSAQPGPGTHSKTALFLPASPANSPGGGELRWGPVRRAVRRAPDTGKVFTLSLLDFDADQLATFAAEVRQDYDELKAKGQEASYEEILTNVKERDYIDQNRAVSPLRQAEDALLLDNSHLTIEEQKQWLKERFEEAVK